MCIGINQEPLKQKQLGDEKRGQRNSYPSPSFNYGHK